MGLHALTQQSDQTGEHVTPTIDDVIADLTGAQYFSKLDLGLVITMQLLLHPDSRYIAMFSNHLRRKWLSVTRQNRSCLPGLDCRMRHCVAQMSVGETRKFYHVGPSVLLNCCWNNGDFVTT